MAETNNRDRKKMAGSLATGTLGATTLLEGLRQMKKGATRSLKDTSQVVMMVPLKRGSLAAQSAINHLKPRRLSLLGGATLGSYLLTRRLNRKNDRAKAK